MRFAAVVLLTIFTVGSARASQSASDSAVGRIVTEEIGQVLIAGEAGAAVAVRLKGRTMFFNFGLADRAVKMPVTSDSLFNLASLSKVFDATLLALAVRQGKISFNDRVDKYVPELRRGRDIRNVTLGELVSFTSGFSLPQDHPPWPYAYFTWRKFARTLNTWKIDTAHERGRQYIYSHAGFMLLHVALERRFKIPYSKLMKQQLLQPLGLASTTIPRRGPNDDGLMAPAIKRRAVQGYSGDGKPIGKPGNMGGYYHWPGTEQMFSSARDMATFLAAQLGEGPDDDALQDAIELTHQQVTVIEPPAAQAHAWEIHYVGETIVDKNGGLHNSTTYIGMIPRRRFGVVILVNRGDLNGRDIGHSILRRLALVDTVPQ